MSEFALVVPEDRDDWARMQAVLRDPAEPLSEQPLQPLAGVSRSRPARRVKRAA